MSEPKQISPLLDGFTIGDPMSDHDGVRCCPAIKENSENKYIVKIISIPASQVQMDALLLSGAYKDASGAMDYYKTVADDVTKEAELLTKLSKLEGFLPYEGWQIEPITRRRLGYEVYLVGQYRRSLDRFVRRNPITQLEAINLGLDICSALSVCRQAGSLYVDLKPTNIFVSEKKEYQIGDLGFVSLDALSYTALPDKYRSPYTPPELSDPMASVSMTTDTYALGMILYQIYNDGQLPPKAVEGEIPSPVHADYELAEIILKAINQDPEKRWQDPREMGQALVAYMQRNSVNDVPITPYIPLEKNVEEKQEPEAAAETENGKTAEVPAEEAAPPEEAAPEAPAASKPDTAEEEPADETAPDEADAQTLMPHEMSDELSRIMAKADDLIAHETPEGVVVPEVTEPADPFAFAKEDQIDDSDVPVDPVMEDPELDKKAKKKEKKKKTKTFASQEGKVKRKRFFSNALTILILAAIGFGLFWSYQNLYVQTIDGLSITGDRSRLSVSVQSDISDELLTATCTDQYGNVLTQPVANGQAAFTGLMPNTMYTISLEIDGFHKLAGETTQVFTTDTTTSILSFTSVAGTEDGSLILYFTVDGDEPEEWTVAYGPEGAEPEYKTFSGHTFSVERLKLGKVYTFTLDAGPDLSLSGQTSLQVMASRLILADDITLASSGNGDLTVRWKTPGDIVVDSWTVRCYNELGYESEVTVQDTEAFFSNIDFSVTCNVEITAAGMTQAARSGVSANPINITDLTVEETGDNQLDLRWDYTGEEPAGGWLLLYSIDGSEIPNVIKTDHPSATISPRIPDAKYRFTIQAADGGTVLSNVREYVPGSAPDFEEYDLKASDLTADLVKTPDKDKWKFEDVGETAFTRQFASGDKISLVLRSSKTFYLPGAETKILYIVRDASGNVQTNLIFQEDTYWKQIWNGGDAKIGELDLPKAPTIPGSYRLDVFIDGMAVAGLDFEIVQ